MQVDRCAERLFSGIYEFDDQFARVLIIPRNNITLYVLDRCFEHLFTVEAVGEFAVLDVNANVIPAPLLHILRDVVGNLRHVVAVDALESRSLVSPAADIKYVAVLSVVHTEVNEKSFRSGNLAGFERDRAIAECFRNTPEVPTHHSGPGAFQCSALCVPCTLLGCPPLRHVGLDGASVGQGDLQVLVFVIGVPTAHSDLSFDPDGDDGLFERRSNVKRRAVLGIHLLHLIRRASHNAVRVEPNEICRPYAIVNILEKRCIRSHFH